VEDSSILVRQEGQKGFARIVGKGSFKNARHLTKYVEKATLSGIRDFVIDLQDCQHMDSTFMGVLAGMAAKRRRENLSTPKVIFTNARNLELLQTLGLDRILIIESAAPADNSADFKALENDASSKAEVTQTMYEAHQHLIDLDASHATQFQDVMLYLKDKLSASESKN
jgi:anti-sigma B factor antagonist